MTAIVSIIKSFDGERDSSKEWENGDFEQFFTEEGEYLDRLCGVLADKGTEDDQFTVVFKVKVIK